MNKKGFGSIGWIVIIGIGIILTLISLVVLMEVSTDYIMPNGVMCKSDMTTGGSFGGATHEFYNCDDGLKYINPEYYREIIR